MHFRSALQSCWFLCVVFIIIIIIIKYYYYYYYYHHHHHQSNNFTLMKSHFQILLDFLMKADFDPSEVKFI